MGKSVKKNYVFNLIYQMTLILIPLISIPYVSRVLLEEGVGIYSYAEAIVSYFTYFAVIGTTTYAHREIGKVQDDPVARSRVFWEIFLIRLFTTCIALAGYGVYLSFLDSDFTVSLIFGLNIINVIADVSWFFQGVEECGKTVIFGIVSKILDFISIFLFIKSPDDLWLYTLIKCGFIVLGNAGMWVLMPRYLKKPGKLRPFRHFKTVLVFFIPVIASQVYTVLDRTMITWYAPSAAENGYYHYAEKIVRMIITVITALGTVLVPHISHAIAEKDEERVKSILKRATSFVWMLSLPMVLGIIAVADIFIPLYLGEHFERSALLMQILSPIILFLSMAQILGVSLLIPLGKQRVNVIAVVIAACVNFCLNLILIPRYLAAGAAAASVAAEFIGMAIQIGYVFRKKYFSAGTFFACSVKYLIASAVMFAAVLLLKTVIPATILGLIGIVACGIAVYAALLFVLRDKFFTEYTGMFFNKLFHRRPKQKDDNEKSE